MINIEKLKKEYDEINQELGKNEVVLNLEKSKPLLRRQKELEPLMTQYERLREIEKAVRDNEEIISKETDQELLNLAKDDIAKLTEEKSKLERAVADFGTVQEDDNSGIIIEIRAGAGGDEAALFAADLFRMYSRFAEKKGWKIELLSSNRIGIGGFKEVIALIGGKNVYRTLQSESGVHRVQRIPNTEKSGRIHTSTASVAIIPEKKDIDIKIKPEDLKIDVMRSGGPGGQNVNKTESAVRLTHLPTGLVVHCQDEKSQLKNRERAMKILRSRLFALEKSKRDEKERLARREQIGSAERSEKIRTYNFPQDRLTDHRIKKNWHNLDKIMDGDIDDIIKEFQNQAK